jgi:hypothetical protein
LFLNRKTDQTPFRIEFIMEKISGYFKKEKWGKTSVLFTLIFLFSSLCHAGSVNDVIGSIDRVKSSEFPIRFAVLGDTRDGDKIYIQLIGKILARKPHFVIHLGDMIPKPGDKAWPHFFAITNRFDCPFFPTAGNHDVGKRKPGHEMYRKQFILPGGRTYYAFRIGRGVFAILDSEEGGGRIGGEQRARLKELLSSSDAEFKLGFLHRPMFPPEGSVKIGKAMDRYPADRDDLHRLFIHMKMNAVFAGDDHRYDRRKVEGLSYIVTGGGGAPLSSPEEKGGYYHFIWMTVQKGRMDGEVVDLEGTVRDKFMIEW